LPRYSVGDSPVRMWRTAQPFARCRTNRAAGTESGHEGEGCSRGEVEPIPRAPARESAVPPRPSRPSLNCVQTGCCGCRPGPQLNSDRFKVVLALQADTDHVDTLFDGPVEDRLGLLAAEVQPRVLLTRKRCLPSALTSWKGRFGPRVGACHDSAKRTSPVPRTPEGCSTGCSDNAQFVIHRRPIAFSTTSSESSYSGPGGR